MGLVLSNDVRLAGTPTFMIGHVEIGLGTFVGHDFAVYGAADSRLVVGKGCDIGPQVTVLAGSHEIGGPDRRAGKGTSSRVSIGDGTWIGGRVTLIGPCDIGAGCLVAAGSVVRGRVAPNTLYRSKDLQRTIDDPE